MLLSQFEITSVDNKIISSWVRQARYRAKRYNLHSDLEISDIHEILQHYNDLCAYCTQYADTLDHAFPLREGVPNVPANVLPCCKNCKESKKNDDLVQYYGQGSVGYG